MVRRCDYELCPCKSVQLLSTQLRSSRPVVWSPVWLSFSDPPSHDNSCDSSSWSSARGSRDKLIWSLAGKCFKNPPAVFKLLHHASTERKPPQGLCFFFHIHKLSRISGSLVVPAGRRSEAEGFGLFKSSFRSVQYGSMLSLSCSCFAVRLLTLAERRLHSAQIVLTTVLKDIPRTKSPTMQCTKEINKFRTAGEQLNVVHDR